ncbi:MAG: hemA [Gammaproteobacteria bacterium]|nr:hemA [Gammaproteobacteria bacterium]
MPIFVCGINHKTAPIALREQVTFAPEKIALYLADLINQENMSEAVLLSTCNRSELYCVTDHEMQVMNWFCRQHRVQHNDLAPFLYCYQDRDAIEHIMNVACGLDSMVLGESEILRQMKDAFSESCILGAIGTIFNRLFQEVFAAAKEVRTSTSIGACPVSVSSAAVNFIRNNYSESFSEASVLLIGAGVAVDLMMRYLKIHPPKRIVIANRNPDNATIFSEQYQCELISLKKLPEILSEVNIIISATGSTLPIVTKSMLAACENALLIVDIAVPRDIEPTAAELSHIRLHSIDDLKFIIQQNIRGREHAADKAREMIKEKSQDLMIWISSVAIVATTIRAYRKQVEDLCQIELTKARRQLERGDNPTEVLTSFSYALTNKLLHAPTVQLRQAGYEGRLEILEVAQKLFSIPAIVDAELELV